jgi:hypothetical protein
MYLYNLIKKQLHLNFTSNFNKGFFMTTESSTRSQVLIGIGGACYCIGIGLTAAGAYYVGSTTDCNEDPQCVQQRIAGIAMTAIGVTTCVCTTTALCCWTIGIAAIECCNVVFFGAVE